MGQKEGCPDARGLRFLFINNGVFSSDLLEGEVRQRRWDVIHACGVAKALKLLDSHKFDALILPGTKTSLEFSRAARDRKDVAATYCLALIDVDDPSVKFELVSLGVDDCLVWPCLREELLARLTVAERRARMQEELNHQTNQLKRLAQFLEAANNRFSQLFMRLPVACITFDAECRIQEWNQASELLYGREPGDVLQQYTWDVASSEADRPVAIAFCQEVIGGKQVDNVEWSCVDQSGKARRVLCSAFPLRAQDQSIVGAISTIVDITERKALEEQVNNQLRIATRLNRQLESKRKELSQANEKLELQATTDGLTELKNYRFLREFLSTEFNAARERSRPVSIVIIDVDKFKELNDAFGHPAGDQVLKSISQLLLKSKRGNDVAARYGGEEFVIVLPGADERASRTYAERLRAAVEGHPWQSRPITISLGIATLSDQVESASHLLDLADRALYLSKQGGRNRATHIADTPLLAA